MQLTEFQIRSIISELILEGYKDEQRYLQEKNPEISNEIGRLGPKYIAWLIARYGENPSREEIEPIRDTIVTIVNFARKDAGIGEKYRANEQFRSSVDEAFPLDTRSWQTPNDISSMTSEVIERILGLSERKKQRFGLDKSTDVERDRVGKVGPWNLWMPTTRERSCEIAQYDPVTMKPKTTWCTARTSGSNLFYNYAGQGIILFYLIKDDPKNPDDWLSVGYIEGKMQFNGDGTESVNGDNKGLTRAKLKKHLGTHYDECVTLMNDKVKSLQGSHPAQQKFKLAAQDINVFNELTQGLSKDEARDNKHAIIKNADTIAPDVLDALDDLRSEDDYGLIIDLVNRNFLTPDRVASLARHPYTMIRSAIARSNNTDPEILDVLARDGDLTVCLTVASNTNTKPETLLYLLDRFPNSSIKVDALKNPNLPQATLLDILQDPANPYRRYVLGNKNIPTDYLESLYKDVTLPQDDRLSLLANPSFPLDILRKAYFESIPSKNGNYVSNTSLSYYVASNPGVPLDIMKKVARHEDFNVRNALTRNPNVTDDILKGLMTDREEDIRRNAKKVYRARYTDEINEVVARIIRRLVR